MKEILPKITSTCAAYQQVSLKVKNFIVKPSVELKSIDTLICTLNHTQFLIVQHIFVSVTLGSSTK